MRSLPIIVSSTLTLSEVLVVLKDRLEGIETVQIESTEPIPDSDFKILALQLPNLIQLDLSGLSRYI
jgi:hypothetical protein